MELQNNPIEKFQERFQEAKKTKLKYPNAVNLATATKQWKPSNRTVLLKDQIENIFTFYTNFTSRKAQEILENPYASLCFHWDELGKQIRIEWKVSQVSDQKSDEYFNSRHIKSRAGAIISKQSQILPENINLVEEVEKIIWSGKDIQRPKYWWGFCVTANTIEFWSEEEYRIHKRELYTLHNNKWEKNLLYP